MLPVTHLLNLDVYFKRIVELIPSPPSGLPKGLPIYNPLEELPAVPQKIAGSLISTAEKTPMPTIPFLNAVAYGGSTVPPNISFLVEFTDILGHFVAKSAELTTKWLAKFEEFAALPAYVLTPAISFLQRVAQTVTGQMQLFDAERYEAYIDMVAIFAYGNLNKLVAYLTDIDKASDAFIDNIVTHTTEEPANYIMSMTRELLGAFLYRFDQLTRSQYDDTQTVLKEAIERGSVQHTDVDKVIKAILDPTRMSMSMIPTLDAEAIADLRSELTAYFDVILKAHGLFGAAADRQRRRLGGVMKPAALVDDDLVRRTISAFVSMLAEQAKQGPPAVPSLGRGAPARPQGGAAVALERLHEAEAIVKSQQRQRVLTGPPTTPVIDEGAELLTTEDVLTSEEVLTIVQFHLQPSSGKRLLLGETAGPTKLEDLIDKWDGLKKQLAEWVDTFAHNVAIELLGCRAQRYISAHENDPCKVRDFKDWLFVRTLKDAFSLAPELYADGVGKLHDIPETLVFYAAARSQLYNLWYLYGKYEVVATAVTYAIYDKARYLVIEGGELMDIWSCSMSDGGLLDLMNWEHLIKLPGGIKNIADKGANLGLWKK
ncbi:unnamed protein product [Vitrella brassicaformis CCMP3155]|uniref:Uncharacterized protein n=1 Tax=Vitrella brassicaformis (strain CCMP3155) TaxID=1169540 RepID=A0A0G4EQC2_VITBC|nr:unnamed protein product [Vitrella brassicaformis CCMP3155]|eukprot:CEL99985.1 unnamed protein product [Vitrella brassicaformis CCMP3155]